MMLRFLCLCCLFCSTEQLNLEMDGGVFKIDPIESAYIFYRIACTLYTLLICVEV